MASIEKPRFIIRFIQVRDIPPPENRSKSDPFIRAYLSAPVQYFDENRREKTRIERISSTVVTLKKLECNHAVWNSYRDFRINPPAESILTVEVLHSPSDTSKSDVLLGKVDIPISLLKSGEECQFELSNYKTNRLKNPRFGVFLQRCFTNEPPPKRKTFFLIRHGESKWNEAQSKINITGMLDRDHALTEKGVEQAKELNDRWREYETKMHESKASTQSQSTSQQRPMPPPKPPKPSNHHPLTTTNNNTTTNILVDTTATTAPSVPFSPAAQSSAFPNDPFGNDPFTDKDPFASLDPFDSNSPPPPTPLALTPAMNSEHTVASSCFHDNEEIAHTIEEDSTSDEEIGNEEERDDVDDIDDDDDILEIVEENEEGQMIHYTTTSPHASKHHSIQATSSKRSTTSTISTQPIDGPATPSHQETLPNSTSTGTTTASSTASTANKPPSIATPLVVSSNTTSTSSSETTFLDTFHDQDMKMMHTPTGKADSKKILQRRDEYQTLFLRADQVYSSPLTRALQTAVVSMEGHPAMKQHGITLYSTIREVKNIGGLDTVGIEIGEGIEKRLRSELQAIYNNLARVNTLVSIPIQFHDTYTPWWTPITSHDNEYDQQDRVREFITFARYCPSQVPVFVGHSLFFKAFYSKRVSHQLYSNRRNLSDNLKKFRLSNASMLAVTVSFVDVENGASDAVMIDADLIYGGGFHVHHHQHDHPHAGAQKGPERVSEDGSSSGGGGLADSIKVGQQHLKTFTNHLASNISNSLPPGFTSTLQQEVKQKKDALTKGVNILSSKITNFFEG